MTAEAPSGPGCDEEDYRPRGIAVGVVVRRGALSAENDASGSTESDEREPGKGTGIWR